MAKSIQKQRAVALRKRGNSVKDIAKIVGVSKSSASIWCRDIVLTAKQIDALHLKMTEGNYKGSIKGALRNKLKREEKIKKYIEEGKDILGVLSVRDILMVGLGLYLGEGGKGRSFQFTNSNAEIILLMLNSLKQCFRVPDHDLVFRVFMNETHKLREKEIIEYWRKLLCAHPSQFRNTVFIKSVSQKLYAHPERYFGVLTVRIKNSGDLQQRIYGLNYHMLRTA